MEYRRDKIKWRAWVDPETPLPTPYTAKYLDKIGAFEGSQYHLTNYFRSSAQGCIMGAGVFDNTERMCAVCEQRLSMRVYTLVHPIENPLPKQNLRTQKKEKVQFSVQRVHPEPDTQWSRWYLNGELIAEGIDKVQVVLDSGVYYEVVYALRDTTSLIQSDPPYGEHPYREHRWFVNSNKELTVPRFDIRWNWDPRHYEQGRRFEAEFARFTGGESEGYFGASEQNYVVFGGDKGVMNWQLEVEEAGNYTMGIVYATTRSGQTSHLLVINDQLMTDSLLFPSTRPLNTGWEMVRQSVYLREGTNTIELVSSGGNAIHVDYLFLPQHPTSDLPGFTRERFELGESIKIEALRKGRVEVKNPREEWQYLWYEQDVPVFELEQQETPLSTGNNFNPPKSGNYYVGARDALGRESDRRTGFYYRGNQPKIGKSIQPDAAKSSKILLWLDASDMDGDGTTDYPPPPRDPYKNWKDKATERKGPFVLYKPNELNGKGVAGFDNVWVTNLEEPVSNYQTIVLVYKESDMSFTGSSPFRSWDELIGRSADPNTQLFNGDTFHGQVYLDRKLIDPTSTANPMDYCILTIEFSDKVVEGFGRTQGYWEGSIAELIVYEGRLSEKERKLLENGLLRKWFSVER